MKVHITLDDSDGEPGITSVVYEAPVWSDQALDEMAEGVRGQLVWTKREDPAELARDLVRKTLADLLAAAKDPEPDAITWWARCLLEQMWHRAESGVPYSWDEEPWSADREEGFER